MLRQNSSLNDPQRNGQAPADNNAVFYDEAAGDSDRFDVQESLNQIEELILDSPRVPLTGRTLINEDELLDQLDNVRLNLPSAFQEAVQLLKQRDEILTEAEQYAQEIVATAEKQAAAILNDMTIIRQAEQQAQQLRSQVEQECAALKAQTLAEVEQLQRQARQEWEDMRQGAIVECQTIQQDADAYADQVLKRMETQFAEMLHVIQNGRQQLYDRQQRTIDADPNARRDLPGTAPVDSRQQALGGHQHRPIQPMQPPRNPRPRR
jgi:F0F1-type ATP synthase membrane subunit b/b'